MKRGRRAGPERGTQGAGPGRQRTTAPSGTVLGTRTERGSQPRGARTRSERQRRSPSPQGGRGQAGRHHGPSEGDVRPLGRRRPAGSPAAATADSPFTDRRPRVTGRRAQGRAGLPRRRRHRGRVQGAGPALRAGGRGRGVGITGPGAGAGGAGGPGQQLGPRLDVQGGRGRRRPPRLALGGGPGEQLQQPLSLFLEKRKKHVSRRHGSIAAV